MAPPHQAAGGAPTPEQRRQVLQTLRQEVEPAESRGMTDDPRDLARLATRTELRRPGTIERVFGAQGPASSTGDRGAAGTGVAFGGFLPTLAGAFMGTALASMMLGGLGGFGPGDATAFEGGAGEPGEAAPGDGGGDEGGRTFGGEWGSDADAGAGAGDLGGEAADLGDIGDLGGFGGGDFGGFDL